MVVMKVTGTRVEKSKSVETDNSKEKMEVKLRDWLENVTRLVFGPSS